MASRNLEIVVIEKRLRDRAGRLLSTSDSVVSSLPAGVAPICLATNEILGLLRDAGFHAYIWGGVVRDLATHRTLRVPRDVDIVVDGGHNEDVWKVLQHFPSRRNRFGGVRIDNGMKFDVFALPDTWAFENGLYPVGIQHLPRTTFLNVEAVVVDTEATRGRPREIISRGFFEALSDRMVEINCESNPFPAVCVIRSLAIARHLDFSIGDRLAAYLVAEGARLSGAQLEDAQRSHYGVIKYSERDIRLLIASIKAQVESDYDRIVLPGSRTSQVSFWPSSTDRRESGEMSSAL